MNNRRLLVGTLLFIIGLLPNAALAGVVNLEAESGIVSIMMGTTNKIGVLTAGGEVWEINMQVESPEWLRRVDLDPPVPVDEIDWWHAWFMVTRTGEVWQNLGSQWNSLGTFPGGGIPVRESTWGGLKGKF